MLASKIFAAMKTVNSTSCKVLGSAGVKATDAIEIFNLWFLIQLQFISTYYEKFDPLIPALFSSRLN